jgi:DNA-binding Xre family transcriptional regulator
MIKAIYLYGGPAMAISYNKLWKLLIDKKMSKADLRRAASIAPNTMTKLRRDEEVSMAVLIKICTVLQANIGDIMDLIPEEGVK